MKRLLGLLPGGGGTGERKCVPVFHLQLFRQTCRAPSNLLGSEAVLARRSSCCSLRLIRAARLLLRIAFDRVAALTAVTPCHVKFRPATG